MATTKKQVTMLPVEHKKYSSRTYARTGQPYSGLGQWLLYQEYKLNRSDNNDSN